MWYHKIVWELNGKIGRWNQSMLFLWKNNKVDKW